jgi:NADPH-dependent 2,4-dienoyl-CoA reductase/sulfur reductase-like enzyme
VGEERVPYDAVVVATGAQPRRLPGTTSRECTSCAPLDDARAVRPRSRRRRPHVVVGAGFIGSAVASAARERGLPLTSIEAAPAPLLRRGTGPQEAPLCAGLHDRAGAELRCGSAVGSFDQEAGRVTGVRLTDGTHLPADLVVVGAGCTPVTGWLTGSGLALDDGVVCDSTLQASAPGVLAAGDVARVDGIRLEHWTSAAEQGTRAGANAAALLTGGTPARYSGVPYFWSTPTAASCRWWGTRATSRPRWSVNPRGRGWCCTAAATGSPASCRWTCPAAS